MYQKKTVNWHFCLVLVQVSQGNFHFPRSFSDSYWVDFLMAEYTTSCEVKKWPYWCPANIQGGQPSADKPQLAQGSESRQDLSLLWKWKHVPLASPPDHPPGTPGVFPLELRKSTFINTWSKDETTPSSVPIYSFTPGMFSKGALRYLKKNSHIVFIRTPFPPLLLSSLWWLPMDPNNQGINTFS